MICSTKIRSNSNLNFDELDWITIVYYIQPFQYKEALCMQSQFLLTNDQFYEKETAEFAYRYSFHEPIYRTIVNQEANEKKNTQ